MRIYFLIAAVLIAQAAKGAWPLDFFTSDPKAALAAADKVPVPEGTDLLVLDEQLRFHVDANNRLSHSARLVYRAVTEAGVKQIREFSDTWTAWREDKPVLKARVITPASESHLLDSAAITEAGIPNQVEGLFTDTKMIAAPLPAVVKGSLIEIEITGADRETVDPNGVAENIPVHFGTAHLQVLIDLPANSPFHLGTPGIANVTRKESKDGDRRQISLEAVDLRVPQALTLRPAESALNPEIVFSTAPDWKEVARWYWEMSEPKIGQAQPPSVGDPTSRLLEIEKILAGIQEKVRYTGVEFGLSAYVPRSPDETLSRGYGDCKDKAALMVNRLRKTGIAANVALLTPYPDRDVEKDVPDAEVFTHAIVYVPGQHPLWIDPTAEYTPARRLNKFDQDRLALIIAPETTSLTRTPENDPREDSALQSFTLVLGEDGKNTWTEITEGHGIYEDFLRAAGSQLVNLSDAQRAQARKQFETGARAEKVSAMDFGQPKDLTTPYRFSVKGEGFRDAGAYEQTLYAFVPKTMHLPDQIQFIASLADAQKDAVKKRTEDFELYLGFVSEERWRVTPPAGFVPKLLPDEKDVSLGPLTLGRTVSLEADGSILFVYRLDVAKHRFTVDEAGQISAALKQPALAGSLRLDFVAEGTLLMSEGKWKEGIDRLRQDASANPPRPGTLLRYSAALLETGLRDDAAEACRKAIAADPNSARAHAFLSFIYRHDPIGRLNKPGMDLAIADQEIQKAAELDPTNKLYVVDRALIKELTPDGEFFADPQQFAESIGLLEGIASDLPKLRQQNILAEALLHALRFAELKAFYQKEEGRGARLDLKLAAIAEVDGTPAAVREAAQTEAAEAARTTNLQNAAHALASVREYAKTAELFKASGRPTAELELLRHARRREDLSLSKDPVIAVVQQFIFALMDRTVPVKYDELLVPEWRSITWNAARAEMVRILAAFNTVAGFNFGTRARADIAVSNIEFIKEGSDALGYRVRFADPSANGRIKTIAWVVRRGDEYKILGLVNSEAGTGGEALAFAEKGDFESARKWLDWQREEIPASRDADPLAPQPIFNLWPAASDPPQNDEVLLAAACLAARGIHSEHAIEVLRRLRAEAKTSAMRYTIDLAIADGLRFRARYDEEVSVAQSLHDAYPSSAAGLTALGNALMFSGRREEAIKLAAAVKQDSLAAPAARITARAHQLGQEYTEAAQAFRDLCAAKKCVANDWNTLAWITLFAPGKVAPDAKAAETAVRMTQDRNVAYVHTLASIQAENGQFKDARAGLLRYQGTNLTISDSAWYLQARIAEGLGLDDTAKSIYSKIAKPEHSSGDGAYDLAQIRLKLLGAGTLP